MNGVTVWSRYVRGNPLFNLAPTDAERAAIRSHLRACVQRSGIGALRSSPEVTRNFVLHASQFLAREATRLEWAPVLRDLDVSDDELPRYVELYDDVSSALVGLGRTLIRHNGERRFLATFLREGGLPAFIGDIAGLVVDRATEIGWDALQDEGPRTWVVGRVQQAATGAARRLLDAAEGRLALADFLNDAARARAALVDAGCDLRLLSTAQSVREALRGGGINLPSVANETLLLAVLASFTSEGAPVALRATPLRLVVLSKQQQVQLGLRVELDALDLDEILPKNQQHATLTAELCRPPRRMLQRQSVGFVDAASRERTTDFDRGGQRGETAIDIRYAGTGGVTHVVPLGVLEWPVSDALWFDRDGELMLERRDVIQPHESFVIVTWDECSMRGDGNVDVRELVAPRGACRAYSVEARGSGSLTIDRDGESLSIAAYDRHLEVVAVHGRAPDHLTACGLVRALPDLIIADGVEVDVFVRGFREPEDRLVRSGARGRIVLSAERGLRDLAGTVRVRLVATEGRLWSASWCVLPHGFEISSRAGLVRVHPGPAAVVVHAEPGRVETAGNHVVVTPPHDADDVVLFLTLPSGESLRFPVSVTRGGLRLRADATSAVTLPLDGTAQLTERQVYAGACLELDAHPGAVLTVASRRGDVIFSVVQRSDRRELIPLLELATHLQRAGESPMRFVAQVDHSGDYAFRVHIPRLGRPGAKCVDDGIAFECSLDDSDLPELPGIALFAIHPPTAAPAIVACDFDRVVSGTYTARLGPRQAPTARGRYIAFLVDRRAEPERPMSGGRAISIPLNMSDLACPADVTGLDRALWIGTFDSIAEELNALVGTPQLTPFLQAFVIATAERARYGLTWFYLLTTVARRCLWVLLAALPHVPPQERLAWLALWPQQMNNFTWLRFTKGDAERLARALPPRSTEERMTLVTTARMARRMSTATEYMLLDSLFSGDSLRPIAAIREAETQSACARRGSWEPYQLPRSATGSRWLRGVELDSDLQKSVDDALSKQVLTGARARAIRALFEAHEVPQHNAILEPLSTPVATWLLAELKKEWGPIATTKLAHQIESLEREVVIACLRLFEYQRGREHLNEPTFNHILALERCSPELLDYWLIAVDILMNEGP